MAGDYVYRMSVGDYDCVLTDDKDYSPDGRRVLVDLDSQCVFGYNQLLEVYDPKLERMLRKAGYTNVV